MLSLAAKCVRAGVPQAPVVRGLTASKTRVFATPFSTCAGRELLTTGESVAASLAEVRSAGPLVQCVTNYVSMDIMANVLLAMGCSPAMVSSSEEAKDFAAIASAVSINVGTLDPKWIGGMKAAIEGANESGKVWVLDPVGMGATPFRSQQTAVLAAMGPTIIRGNASEVLALQSELMGGEAVSGKGVDASHSASQALAPAVALARHLGCIVVVTGEDDYATDGERTAQVSNGSAMATLVTAAGCSLSSAVAAYAAVLGEDRLMAAAHALAVYGVCGEIADENSQGPGSFRVAFLDALHNVDADTIRARANISMLP